MKNWTLCLILFFLAGAVCRLDGQVNNASEFVIVPATMAKKNMSAGALKEEIGKTTKQAFDGTTLVGKHIGQSHCSLSSLQKRMADDNHDDGVLKKMLHASAGYTQVLGNMQQKLSQLQQKCSSIIEKLIDNQAPFKRASKKMLENTLSVLSAGRQEVSACTKALVGVNADLKKTASSSGQPSAMLEGATKKLQRQVAMLEQTVTTFNVDECLKSI